jgi:hypothetical protein
MLETAHDSAALKKSQVYERNKSVRDGRASVNDDPLCGNHQRRQKTKTSSVCEIL